MCDIYNKTNIMYVEKEVLIDLLSKSNSKSALLKYLHLSDNGRNRKHLDKLINEFKLDLSILKVNRRKDTKFINKICPVCESVFETVTGEREKKTCSYSCSTTFFRSGVNNPNWKDEAYRTTCFLYHEHKCVVCGEDKIIDVHHYDENKHNNTKENLIPLCPTHHKYWHSRYKYLVEKEVEFYRTNFINNIRV